MNNELVNKLALFREITLMALEATERLDDVKLIELLDERQKCIDDFIKLNIPKEEFADMIKKLQIEKLEDKLKFEIRMKQKEISAKLNNISKGKNVVKNYNSGFINKSRIFSKKV